MHQTIEGITPNEDAVNHTAELLLAWARNIHAYEAAIGLLVDHGVWLCRGDFISLCVVPDSAGTMAWIDWDKALSVTWTARPSDLRVLSIAAELAGTPSGKSLAVLIAGLGTADMARVLNALQHANRGGQLENNVVPLRRQYLHRYDFPLALGLLESVIGTRAHATDIGYEPKDDGVWVNWGRLVQSNLSRDEVAAVWMALGTAWAEQAGGLPPSVGPRIVAAMGELED